MTKKRKRILISAALLLGAISVPAAVWAGNSHAGGLHRMMAMHGHHAGAKPPANAEELRIHLGRAADFALCGPGLPTPVCGIEVETQQREAVDALLDDLAPRLFQSHSEGHQLHGRLRAEMQKDQPDPEALESLRAELIQLADRTSKSVFDAMLELTDILTPEQRQRLHEKLAAFHDAG